MPALCAGLLESGCDVIDLGAAPTPVLYFATHTQTSSGVMLTGSHNPPNYNGLKIVLGGKTLAGEEIQSLYQRIIAQQFMSGNGHYSTVNMISRYITHITREIHLSRKLKIVVDCGSGIAGCVAPILYKELGCDVIPLFCDVDGNFPYHHPDPSQPENLRDLQQAVLSHKADVGLAFDGDGDRLGVVTNTGEIIWPDRQLMLFASDILKRHSKADIIYDVKCSNLLEKVIRERGGNPCMWKTGHSFIKSKMAQMGALLAGEMSGHIFFKERWFGFDDGIYAGARLLEILSGQLNPLSEIFSVFPASISTPELKLSIPEEEKFIFMEQFTAQAHFENAKITHIDGVRADFADGWGLMRASNTTPCLVLRFEADNYAGLERIRDLFAKQLASMKPQLNLSPLFNAELQSKRFNL